MMTQRQSFSFKTLEDVPDWAKDSVQKLVDRGALTGDGAGTLNLSGDLVRTLVILDRLGMFEKKEEVYV